MSSRIWMPPEERIILSKPPTRASTQAPMGHRFRRPRSFWNPGNSSDASGSGNPFPFDIPGLSLFVWGDAMTNTGDGTPITFIEDLSPAGDDAFGAAITQPVTADNSIFNGHTSAKINTGGHWQHSGPTIVGVASGVNKPWALYGSIALITNSVASVAGWGSTTITSRWTCNFSRGGANRDLANVKIRDTGAATTSDGALTMDATPTTYGFHTTGIVMQANLGGVAEALAAGGVQTSGQLTVDTFCIGAQLTAGVFTAVSQIYLRALVVYNQELSAVNEERLLEWMANDAARSVL